MYKNARAHKPLKKDAKRKKKCPNKTRKYIVSYRLDTVHRTLIVMANNSGDAKGKFRKEMKKKGFQPTHVKVL